MKTIFLLVFLLSAISLFAQPEKEEIKKFKIKKVFERRIENADTTTKTWWYDRKGYDSVRLMYGETQTIKNTFKSGRLVTKTISKAEGKPDVYIYVYNADGSYKETYTDGSFGMKSYAWYDKKDKLLKSQSPDRNTTTYKYDAKGKLLSVKSDGVNQGVKYDHRSIYNAKGQLIRSELNTDGNKSVINYEYDQKGKLVKKVQKGTWEGDSTESTSQFEYNDKGLTRKMTMITRAADTQEVISTIITEYQYEYY